MHFVKVIKSKCLNSLKFSLSLIVSVRLHARTYTCIHVGVGRDQQMPLANQSTQMEVPYTHYKCSHSFTVYGKTHTHKYTHTWVGVD